MEAGWFVFIGSPHWERRYCPMVGREAVEGAKQEAKRGVKGGVKEGVKEGAGWHLLWLERPAGLEPAVAL